MGLGAGDGNAGRTVRREAVNAGGDGGKSYGTQTVLPRERKAIAVAGGRQRVFFSTHTAPDGPDRVDDMAGRQSVAGGDERLSLAALTTASTSSVVISPRNSPIVAEYLLFPAGSRAGATASPAVPSAAL